MGLEYLFFKAGPLTMPPSQLGAFAKIIILDQILISRACSTVVIRQVWFFTAQIDGITPAVCNLQPTSRGP